MDCFDVVIVGSGPAGLGAAFSLLAAKPGLSILILDKEKFSTGGLRNDCKMNFTYPIGFPEEVWPAELAEAYLARSAEFLKPDIMEKRNVETYARRARKIGVSLVSVRQAHLGTDGGLRLIKRLVEELRSLGAEIALEEECRGVDPEAASIETTKRSIRFKRLVIAPGRGGFAFLQEVMRRIGVPFTDNVVDIGLRIETRQERYPIVADYYDPKFLFPKKTRTFCTNSGSAHVVQERYVAADGRTYYSVNGHAFSGSRPRNGLVNFAMLKTVSLTEPLASGQAYAEMLGIQASLLGGGKPIMQRVGDFRLGKRSTRDAFSGDLYDFEPTLPSACPGDISLSVPAKVLRSIWKSLKQLDSIVPGVLHPSTVMYYPEIKLYANKPAFVDDCFMAREGIYLIGDGAGTSRGITGAWASGMRAADGILKSL
jgi:uncharacterized protein